MKVAEAAESNTSEIENCLVPSQDLGMKVDSLHGPSEIIVHAQVNYNLCPESSLMDDNIKAIDKIIFRNNHMKNYVKSIEYGKIFNRRNKSNSFDHMLEIKLTVYTTRLWESAWSFIWKQIGQDQWTLSDGSLVTFNRIHVK